MSQTYDRARGVINVAKSILIVSHRRPDADTVGAALALKSWLIGEGKLVDLACADAIPDSLRFLPDSDGFIQDLELSRYDLMIVVDCGASYMTNFHRKYENFFDLIPNVVNIDHHSSNDNFGDVNVVEPEVASTTLILFKMFQYWGVEIGPEIATALLAGIYGDTGSFMHSNTTEEVLDVAGALLSHGARLQDITKNLFNVKEISTLRLWGKVLENAALNEDGVVMSVVNEEDFDFAKASTDSLSGVVDYLNMVPDSRFAILLNEDGCGNVKGSFRTRQDDLDLSKIAADFGGGGHPKASGFSLPGRLEKHVSYTIVKDDMSKQTLEF